MQSATILHDEGLLSEPAVYHLPESVASRFQSIVRLRLPTGKAARCAPLSSPTFPLLSLASLLSALSPDKEQSGTKPCLPCAH